MRKLIPMMLASLLYPAAGYSLGMGEIRLHSGLNQPLSAEIDLLSVGNEDATTISAGLASSELFAQLGIDRSSTLLLVKFEVLQRPNGTYYVKATSKQAIREPYLDFLLEVNWKTGRTLREYTVLLDPPELTKQAPVTIQPPAETVVAPVVAPVPGADEAVAPEASARADANSAKDESTQTAAEPAEGEGAATAEAAAPESSAAATQEPEMQPGVVAGAEASAVPVEATKVEEPAAIAGAPARSGVITYGPVRSDETLWNIAKRVRPDRSVTVPQVMTALVRQNPYAFYGKNGNRLKAGHVLRLDPAQLAQISREEAAREVTQQGREWQDYKQRAATQADSRTPTTGTESEAGAAVASAKKDEPRLKLVTPQENGKSPKNQAAAPGTGATDADALRKELMLAIETTEAQKQENEELRKRLQELEGQVTAMQRLLSLKDNDLAALQRQAGQASDKGAPAKETLTQPPAVATAPAPQQATPAVPAQSTPSPAVATEQKAPSATPVPSDGATPAKPEQKAPVAKPVVKAPLPPPVPVEEPSFFSGLLTNPVVVGTLATVALLLGVIGFFIVRRRRSGASFQESILMGGSPSMLKAKASESATKEETSFFSDFAVSGMGDIHTEDSEVDPLTEADVYMAYQRFQQAEELLRDAMKQHDKPELHVKLLEVYHATRDKAAFETEAVKVNGMLNGTGPLWDKVLVLGHELLPQHPLFAQAPEKMAPDASHADARLDNEVLDIGLDLDALAEEMESGAQSAGEFNLDLGVDFSDLEKPAAAPAPAAPKAAEPTPAVAAPVAPVAAQKKEEAPLEFDLGDLSLHLDEEAPAAVAKPEAKPAPAVASGPEAIDFGALDLGDLDLGGAGETQAEPAEELGSHGAQAGGVDSGELDLGDFDLSSLNAEAEAVAKEQPELSIGEIDLADLGEIQLEAVPNPGEGDDESMFGNLDEAGTKLDLARAYMEMGDPDGARGILDEVLQEGNADQKQQAQDLLKQIA